MPTTFARFLFMLTTLFAYAANASAPHDIYVSTRGNDTWQGTEKKPVATFARAQQLARQYAADDDVTVWFDDGIYYLPQTIVFTAADSKTRPATANFRARHTGKAVISGGQEMHLKCTLVVSTK